MLAGIEVPKAEREEFLLHLNELHYPYTDETANTAYACSWADQVHLGPQAWPGVRAGHLLEYCMDNIPYGGLQGARGAREPAAAVPEARNRVGGRRLVLRPGAGLDRNPGASGSCALDHHAQRFAGHSIRAVDQSLQRMRAWL